MKHLGVILLIPFFISSCATMSSVQLDEGNVKRLTQRSDAQLARKAAPEWCRDSLKTINYLESRIKILELKETSP